MKATIELELVKKGLTQNESLDFLHKMFHNFRPEEGEPEVKYLAAKVE